VEKPAAREMMNDPETAASMVKAFQEACKQAFGKSRKFHPQDRMECPKCGNTDIAINTYQEMKPRGCITVILYILLAITILGCSLSFLLC